MRPLALSLASGSVSSLVIAAVRELAGSSATFSPLAQDICPILYPEVNAGIDLKSLVIGILIGLLLGPLIDLLYFARHSLPRLLYQPHPIAPAPRPLHRVLDGQPRY